MMKKLVVLMLSFMMILSLAACGNKEDKPADDSSPAPTQTVKPENNNPDDADKKITPGVTDEPAKPTDEPAKPTDEPAKPTDEPSAPDAMSVSDAHKDFLAQWTLVRPAGNDPSYADWEFRDIAYTGWRYTGGLVNGAEVEPSSSSNTYLIFNSIEILEEYGITENLTMQRDSDSFSGTYTILDDGYMMRMVLENSSTGEKLEYIGALVLAPESGPVYDTSLLVLFPDSSAQNVLYFKHISET